MRPKLSRYSLTDEISALLGEQIIERGENYLTFCPLHENRRTPAFSINLDNGLWYCHGCNEKGNLYQLYDKLGEVPDGDLKLRLAVNSTQLVPAERPNFDNLSALQSGWLRSDQRGQSALAAYAGRRGIHPSFVNEFSVGYDRERNALALPYFDGAGQVRGIKYRYARGGKASEGGSEFGLYNLPRISGAGTVLLCEGESDTHAAWSRLSVVQDSDSAQDTRLAIGGTSGASVDTRSWELFSLDLLFAGVIYLAYDADDAGDSCAERAMKVLGERAIRLRPTKGKDLVEHFIAGGTFDDLDGADSNFRLLAAGGK